jgi:enoyl-[acyl-carrier-protein] reductase (NADH)
MLKMMKEAGEAGRLCTPQDIGNMVAYLASDFSKKIYGHVMHVSSPFVSPSGSSMRPREENR